MPVQVAEADEEDVDKAVKAARKAFDEGPWPRVWATSAGTYICAAVFDRLNTCTALLDVAEPI